MLLWFRGLDNFTIFLTSCSGCCSMVFYVIYCLKAGLVYDLLRSVRLLLLVVNGVDFPDAVFELLCLQCFEVSVYVVFYVLCRSFGSCFTCAGNVMTSFAGRECVFGDFYVFCWGLSFCLNFNFCGFSLCCFILGKVWG